MAWYAHDIDAYDADTMHLSAAEDGIYSRLMRFYYKTRVPLPDDDRALAAIARISEVEWASARATVRGFFKPRRGRLHHKRCDKELDKEDSLARKRSDKARNAAEKRHGKTRRSLLRAHSEHVPSMDTVMLHDATRPDQRREESKTPPQPPRRRGGALDGDMLLKFTEWYETYPRHVARQPAERAFLSALEAAPFEELVAGARRYAKAVSGRDPDKIAHPATWLNQRRWQDETPLLRNGHINGRGEHKPKAPMAGTPEFDEMYRKAGG